MKPGVFSQLYIQLVFAVKNRNAVLHPAIRDHVFEYISGIITQMGHKSIIVNGVSDHIHLFVGLNPGISISDTVHDVKRSSSLFINQEKFCTGHFNWQEGYGAFSYSQTHINNVYKYIQNQESHHQKRTFRDEYLEFLKKFQIEFDEHNLFDFFD
ncbi:MAG: IS200/IS605 family transposase [Candidatus Neomarinimicrobiota bacterium]